MAMQDIRLNDQPEVVTDDELRQFISAISQIDSVLREHYNQQQQHLTDDFLQVTVLTDLTDQESFWAHRVPAILLAPGSRLSLLCERFELNEFELVVLLLGCLHGCEPCYRPLLSALNPDRQPYPTYDLALTLFCPGAAMRVSQRASFQPDAPLLYYGLIEPLTLRATDDMQHYQTCEHVWLWLMGEAYIPSVLQQTARWIKPDLKLSEPVQSDMEAELLEVQISAGGDGENWCATCAHLKRRPALCVSWQQLLEDERQAFTSLKMALNLARLYGAMLVFDLRDSGDVCERRPALHALLERQVSQTMQDVCYPWLACLVTGDPMTLPFSELSRCIIRLTLPSAEQRHQYLLDILGQTPGWDTRLLTRRVALSTAQMGRAVQEAHILGVQRGAAVPEEEDYRMAFLRRARQNFADLAQRRRPGRSWDDITLSEELTVQIGEIMTAVQQRSDVLRKGFDLRLGDATGISALFEGDSGTGKTLVAEVIANELGVDLIRVDLSTVVNKYIGETSKNLARIFDLAAQDAGVLFFDEADALFGKRSEAKEAKDRYANLEVAYLLQRMEQHPGLVILATNHRGHLDAAFTRRFTFITHFTYPDAALREKMWEKVWPPEVIIADNISFANLARIALTGASIRNAALLSAWLAGTEGGVIQVKHVETAIRRELSKQGRSS